MTLSKEEKRWFTYIGLGVLILIALYFINRNRTIQPAQPTPQSQPITFGTTPGIPDTTGVYNGGPNSVATIATLNINENLPAYVSNAYLPLFGLVGFGYYTGAS